MEDALREHTAGLYSQLAALAQDLKLYKIAQGAQDRARTLQSEKRSTTYE